MALGSGQLSLADIAGEYGGSAPHAISEYYSKGNAPSSGEIQIHADFQGTSNYIALSASGGSVATSGDYKIVTFTSSGSWAVTAASGAASNTVDYLVVAGGGNPSAGGGGAGATTEECECQAEGAVEDSHGCGMDPHAEGPEGR